MIGGSGQPSGVPAFILGMVEALGPEVECVVVSEADRGGYSRLPALGVRHVALEGLASSFNPLTYGKARRNLARTIADERPDLVWAHARAAVHLCRELFSGTPPVQTRLAVSLHGLPFDPGHRRMLRLLSLRVEARHLRHTQPHHIHLLTEGDAALYRRMLGRVTERHALHILGTTSHRRLAPAPAPRPASGTPLRLIMTTRPGYQKNLVAAAHLVAALRVPWRLDLYGSGTDSPRLVRAFRRVLGASISSVGFHGAVSDVGAALDRADLYLSTSRYEGMSIGVHEAFQAGLPLALSDIHGNRIFLATHPFATALPAGRPQEAARRIENLWAPLREFPDHRAEAGRAWHRHFAPEQWTSRAHNMLRAMLSDPLP
ncbi:glycosyltransferase [Celeribacter indicus]|uniref:Group 1 glycosyl transferase n=2 Tax=Celeribacter indicus TaxID=1208324 RepID=A0A0B5DWY7_9RHOB|nr:glycosyltransferase [Celeribacter indicus]AJE44722.1 group 1 glycosyl transferase [Celeribacter indicus]SDX55110.1 Glycosyltransferase involved in cell wall bisynthesis [Celeribacter indicus]